MGNHLALFSSGLDMDCAIVSKVNGVNEAVSQGLAEYHSAWNDVRHSQSSSSKILTRACWNVRTLLQKGKLENIKHEMARLGINILRISGTRWPGEDDCKSDIFRIINSGGEESQRKIAVL